MLFESGIKGEGHKCMDELYSDFAYDDAFRTMVVKCDELLIPFINYMFGEHYSNKARIYRGSNEHFVDKQGGAQDKRITDSLIKIVENNISHTYHVECESKEDVDGTIIVRIFEYDAQIALERSRTSRGRLDVYFPHTGILFLSSTDSTPDSMEIVIHTSGGDCEYSVEVIKELDFDLDKIYDNSLFFLLPFYSFNYKKDFDKIEADDYKQEEFVEIFRRIVGKLESLVEEELLSAYSKDVIIRLINKVIHKQLMKYKSTQKRVGDLMGGKVLDLDVIRAHDEGIEKGIEQGKDEERLFSIRRMMNKLKMTAEEAMDTLDIPKGERSKYMTML